MERREGLGRVVERGWEKAKGRQLWESVKGTDLQYTTANYISTPSHTHHHTHTSEHCNQHHPLYTACAQPSHLVERGVSQATHLK